MKQFNTPEITIIRFDQTDIISTSTCVCVDCTVCPPGKNDCGCYDFGNE